MPPWAISAQAVRAIHCPATHACMCERDVGQCHGDQHSWLPGQHARQPGSLGSTPAPDGHPCNGHIADDEETPQIALPHLRRPAKPGLAPRRVLAWRQADPEPAPDPIRGREIPSLCEALPWRSQCRECDGRDRPNARNRHQPPRDIVFRGDLPDLRRQSIDLPRQIVDLCSSSSSQSATTVTGSASAAPFRMSLRRGRCCGPFGATRPFSAR